MRSRGVFSVKGRHSCKACPREGGEQESGNFSTDFTGCPPLSTGGQALRGHDGKNTKATQVYEIGFHPFSIPNSAFRNPNSIKNIRPD